MFVYTRKNIIMDQRDLRLREAIGKTVYCSSDIHQLLKNANENKFGFYVDADGELMTFDTFIRKCVTNEKYYIGGTVDYHF